jgi:hypothetical protein
MELQLVIRVTSEACDALTKDELTVLTKKRKKKKEELPEEVMTWPDLWNQIKLQAARVHVHCSNNVHGADASRQFWLIWLGCLLSMLASCPASVYRPQVQRVFLYELWAAVTSNILLALPCMVDKWRGSCPSQRQQLLAKPSSGLVEHSFTIVDKLWAQ